MKKMVSIKDSKKQYFTREELGITCVDHIDNELWGQFRSRDIWVSNRGRVVSGDFQGLGQESPLFPEDDGHGLVTQVRRKHFKPNGERLNNMVAEVFLVNPGNCKRVRYLDGDYHNCKVENLYYYYGHMEKAGRKFPDSDIFDYYKWFPFKIGETVVEASGVVATTRKSEWDKGERLRRLETMLIKDTQRTDSGFNSTVVDGGGAVSLLEVIDGRFVLKTSWGACITVGKVNIPIEDESDLKSVLLALKEIYTDFVNNETPMELVDMHIENLDFTRESTEEAKAAYLMAA